MPAYAVEIAEYADSTPMLPFDPPGGLNRGCVMKIETGTAVVVNNYPGVVIEIRRSPTGAERYVVELDKSRPSKWTDARQVHIQPGAKIVTVFADELKIVEAPAKPTGERDEFLAEALAAIKSAKTAPQRERDRLVALAIANLKLWA